MILSGVLHDGRDCLRRLEEVGFSCGQLYDDVHQRALAAFSYVANGRPPPILADAFGELVERAKRGEGWLEGRFPTSRSLVNWMVGLWQTPMWLADEPGPDGWRKGMVFWADPLDEDTSQATWAALAAAAKVRHLASRRAAIHAALEILRDAASPVGDASEIDDRTNDLGEY